MSPAGNGDGLSEEEEADIEENVQLDDQDEVTNDDQGQEDERANEAGDDDGQEDEGEEADVLTVLVRIGHRLGYCETDISTIDWSKEEAESYRRAVDDAIETLQRIRGRIPDHDLA